MENKSSKINKVNKLIQAARWALAERIELRTMVNRTSTDRRKINIRGKEEIQKI